jgi:hypothetical protein
MVLDRRPAGDDVRERDLPALLPHELTIVLLALLGRVAGVVELAVRRPRCHRRTAAAVRLRLTLLPLRGQAIFLGPLTVVRDGIDARVVVLRHQLLLRVVLPLLPAAG